MTVQVNLEKTYSLEEFLNSEEDLEGYELLKGELVEMAPPGLEHGIIVANLITILKPFVDQNSLGLISGGSSYILSKKGRTVVAPDVAFIKTGRLNEITAAAAPLAPDLAVEVISPSDVWNRVYDKIEEYLNAGVSLIWVIFPRGRFVQVYHTGSTEVNTLNLKDELDGESVLPGFTLAVKELFNYK